MARPGPHAALARPALRAGDRLPRLPALVGRVQGDGPGLVRQAALPRRVPRDRPARARTASTRSSRSGWRSGSARRGCGAGRSSQRHYDIAHSLQVVLEETVLELARWLHEASGVRRPLHGRRRGAELRDERPAPRPRAVPATSGCSPPPATPAPPWARRSGSTPSERGDGARPYVDGPRLPRPELRRRRDRGVPALVEAALPPARRRRRGDGRDPGAGQGDRLVPGPDGVRPAGPGRAVDPGLADPRRDAGAAQRDQGPRGLPPGRPGRAGGGGGRLVRRRRRLAVHAVRLRRPAREGRPDPRRAPRRRHGPHPDDQPRPEPALLRPAQGVPGADRRAGAGQHVVQHPRRADRLHAARRGRVLLDLAAGRPGDRLVPAGEAGGGA